MEENRFHELHPLKRFKLRQQREEEEAIKHTTTMAMKVFSSQLPAKKRKKCLTPSPLRRNRSTATTTTCCLPAKKRVWALQPQEELLLITPEKPSPSFDLNVEYQQTPEKESLQSQKKLTFCNESDVHGSEENEAAAAAAAAAAEEVEEEGEEEEEEDDGIVCAVCQSTDGDPSDPIVFCDGCDLMVHATCFGDPLIQEIPEGDWFCSRCQAASLPSSSSIDEEDKEAKEGFSCCLCPEKGGALKPTTDNRWAHILCALLVPEVYFKNPEGREGIDCSRVPDKRWEQICYVCNSTSGCAIECSEPKCSLAFHVTCGLKEELCIEYREGRSERKGAIVAGFCKTHTKLWERQQQTGKFRIVAREEQ